MKTPNGKFVTIKTTGWQEAFDRIVARMTKPIVMLDMMSQMFRELEVPADEQGVINSYLSVWLQDAVGRSNDVRMVKRGGNPLIKKPAYERDDH